METPASGPAYRSEPTLHLNKTDTDWTFSSLISETDRSVIFKSEKNLSGYVSQTSFRDRVISRKSKRASGALNFTIGTDSTNVLLNYRPSFHKDSFLIREVELNNQPHLASESINNKSGPVSRVAYSEVPTVVEDIPVENPEYASDVYDISYAVSSERIMENDEYVSKEMQDVNTVTTAESKPLINTEPSNDSSMQMSSRVASKMSRDRIELKSRVKKSKEDISDNSIDETLNNSLVSGKSSDENNTSSNETRGSSRQASSGGVSTLDSAARPTTSIVVKKVPQESSIYFVPLEHEPRIYLAAPSGVQVTRVTAIDRRYTDSSGIIYTLHSPRNDSQFFQIHSESGNITTRRYIAKKAGEFYNLTVVAYHKGISATMDFLIRVAEYNRYPPEFEKLNYTVELDILTPVKTEFLTVRAVDNDTQHYNSEVYYSMLTIHDVVTVNRTTGVLTLNKSLRPNYKHMAFTILAKDGGSPQRVGRTKLTITIKIISVPRDITVVETGDQWLLLCWNPPLSGHPLGYLLYLQSNLSTQCHNVTNRNLWKKNGMLCSAIDDLLRWAFYNVQLAGWNKDEVGIIAAPLAFSTRVNRSCHSVNTTDYECTCLLGYYGDDCSSFNPCAGPKPPCKNGGSCTSNASYQFSCTCLEGYYGTSCEHFNPCSRSPCQHGSTCKNITSSKYKCLCLPGYSGNMCEININECESNPCQNFATCIDGLDKFTCQCKPGFEGTYCQHNLNECKEDPCQNGATCVDSIGSYYCKCLPGYDGQHCENNIDDCQSNPCENNGTCVDGIEDYYCNCQAGFEGDYCEDEVNECMARPCLNGGTCTDAFNDFSCDCPPGYNGKRCEWDVDLCQSQPCQNNGECVDLIDHIECRCPRGYQGSFCEMKVHCPAEIVKSDRGIFSWEPVPHGTASKLPCPYGMNTNYTEHVAPSSTPANQLPVYGFEGGNPSYALISSPELRLRFPGLAEQNNRIKRFSVGVKNDPIRLHAHLKDIEYRRAQDFDSYQKQQEAEMLKLRIDDEGRPYAVRSCMQLRDGSVKWTEMIDTICRDERSTRAERWSLELEHLTKDPSQINVQVFINASVQIKKILNFALTDRKIAQSMFSVISNMMGVNDTVLEDGDKHGSITKSLIHVIDRYINTAKLPSDGKLVLVSDNLALEVREINVIESGVTVEGLSYSPPQARSPGPAMFLGGLDESEENQDISVSIPREAIERALKQIHKVRAQFVSYKNSKFFRSSNNTSNYNTVTSLNSKQHVISAALSNLSIGNLTEPLVYSFRNTYGKSKQICVYWDTESQEWLEDGVITNQSMDWIQCESAHMTAFSVLLDPSIGMSIPEKHKHALSIISYTGSICSVIGLFLTVLTYSMFRCLNRDRSGKILLNLCVSLLLMNLAFLMVAVEEYVDNRLLVLVDTCTAVALLTHYLVLTSLMWMLVEALNMYHLLITVFATSETKFMCKRMVFAWGLPVTIVAGSATYDLKFYSTTDEYCMVTSSYSILYYLAYLGPTCFILAINCIVFILVTKVLFQRRGHAVGKVGINSDSPVITVAQIRGAFTVMTLLGVTWVFGALALGELKLVFQYVFCICNSLQGFIIFLVRCVQYPEARMAWRTFLHTGKLKKHRGPQGHGLPSSSAGNSHSRHTISSQTQSSQSQQQGLPQARSHSQCQLPTRLRSSKTSTNRTTSLPESSSCLSNNTVSGSGSLWSRFRKREHAITPRMHAYSQWSFRSIFGSNRNPTRRPRPGSTSQNEKGKVEPQNLRDKSYCCATPISATLTRELKQTLKERNADLRLTRAQSMQIQPVCYVPERSQSSDIGKYSKDWKQGVSTMNKVLQHSQPTLLHQNGKPEGCSQQSLTGKEGELTSWEFMRAPQNRISESNVKAVVTGGSHSHSDQGYSTAEHSPESPRQEPKQAPSGAIQPDSYHHDQRLTVSTPDHLYPDPNEKASVSDHNGMLARSDGDITVLIPKPDSQICNKGPATYFVLKSEPVHPDLIYGNNTNIQHAGAGGGLIMETGLFYGVHNRDIQEVRCLDHPPQPRPGYSSRRSSSTSEGHDGGTSSSGSLQSESYSLEMEPRVIQFSTHRRPLHHRRFTKRIRCEEVL
ncbi:uncharacterized protein [Periplaneta americana]|uniref:uncharacterized protein n=1 Tax=Periplaneta americana TaxID=6978 RepID=UPI0037E75AC4